jgi:hypothetical protein
LERGERKRKKKKVFVAFNGSFMEDTKLAARVYASSYVKETRDKRREVLVRKKGGGTLCVEFIV